MKRRFAAAAAALALTTSVVAQANEHLTTVGPISPANGYPMWYGDDTGRRLELCLDPTNPLCGALAVPNPAAPVSFPANFPDESFYMLGQATMPTNNGGQALLVLALEAAFANGPVVAGDQVVFGRVRIRIDNLQPGATYRVTHPYGVETFENVEGGRRGVNFTSDIGIGAPGDFTGALQSAIGPFLRWPSGAPAGYIGDPNVANAVTGSPFGTNFFRIEGPNVGGPGVNVIQTNLFTLMGKISTKAGVTANRATYGRTTAGITNLDVFGSTLPNQAIAVSGTGITAFTLTGNAAGQYFGHLTFNGAPPATLQVANNTDIPPTVLNGVRVTDEVNISRAEYDPQAQTLVISARSSDAFAPPTLRFGLLALTNGELTVSGLTVPPPAITVTSSAGGATTVPVAVRSVDGPQPPPPDPVTVVANAGTDRVAPPGSQVTLDGSASSGATTFAWQQISGPAVTLTGANTAQARFTMPNTSTPLVFRLRVTGANNVSATDDVQVTRAVDRLTTTTVEFRNAKREWRVEGTASIAGQGNTITIRLGSTLTGPILGTATVDALGVWTFRVRNGPNPPASRTISIQSSMGGQLLAVPITVRN